VDYGSCPIDPGDGGGIPGLCFAVRANKVLGGDGYYKLVFRVALFWI